MLKINDIAVIYRSYVHEEDIPFSSYRDGDVCIILDVYEGGTESWSGRDVGPSYKVLNESSGETIHLDDTVWLKPYEEMFDKPYKRKSEEELKAARKQRFMEWVEAEKQQLYESKLNEGDIVIRCCIEDIQELEKGYKDEKYTTKYFNTEMCNLVNKLEKYSYKLNEVQVEFKNELQNKYNIKG
jgi:flagellar biosynthesis/type III secretory pathway protein FliH